MSARAWRTAGEVLIKIPRNHPALAGHFPGNPIVPGVTILDCVVQQLPPFLNDTVRVTGFATVKFIAPLAPEVEFEIQFQRKGAGQAAFEVVAAGGKIASGTVAYELV